jgi:hypothetical protein
MAVRARPGKPVFHFPMARADVLSVDWLEDLAEVTKTVTIAADDFSADSLSRLIAVAAATRSSLAIKTSPFYSGAWLTTHDPRSSDTGGHFAYERTILNQIKVAADAANVPVLAIIADTEIFNFKNPGEANEVAWNTALVALYNAMYALYKDVFPGVHVHWYSRGWVRWINAKPSVARILPKYIHFTLDEDGDDVSPVIYRPEFYNQERAVFDLTASLGRSIGQNNIGVWISLGFGSHYSPGFTSENWLYPVEAAHRWGKYLLYGNDDVIMVMTYPSPGRSPYYWQHFEPFILSGGWTRRFWRFSGFTSYEP